jgi:hypothetical protein
MRAAGGAVMQELHQWQGAKAAGVRPVQSDILRAGVSPRVVSRAGQVQVHRVGSRVVARRLSTFLSPWKRLIYSSRTPGATVACSSISHCACTLMAWWPWWRRSSRVSSDITFFLLRSGQMTLLPFTPCMNVLNYFTDACRRLPPVVRPEAVPVDGLVVQAHLRALVPAGGNVGICHRSAARPPCGQAGDDVPRQG